MSVFFIIFGVWVFIIFLTAILSSMTARRRRVTRSDDGHFVPPSQDLTCEGQYGHDHGGNTEKRYIVHEDPEEGYVILNGVKRRIRDCKYL
ncbi:MAG: hypothetical protein IKG46_06240 [Solobacterium sp.]|nr:hypothetical protein [Solobacterium sp.]